MRGRSAALQAGVVLTALCVAVVPSSRDKFGNDRGADGVTDGYVVLATLVPGTSPTFNGSNGAVGVSAVSGTVTFNPLTNNHDVSWTPTIAGDYLVKVTLWEDWRVYSEIYGSPFRAVVAPALTSARESDAWGQGLISGVAGTMFNFSLLARDASGNPRALPGDDWKVLAVLQNTGIGVMGSCVDPYRNGTASCNYVPTYAGTYTLAITLNGTGVRNSPYTVTVNYAANYPARCNASGPGIVVRTCRDVPSPLLRSFGSCAHAVVCSRPSLQSAIVGTPINFTLYNRDAYGNIRTVNDILGAITLSGNVANVAVAYIGSGQYNVTFNATSAGLQNLRVLVNGADISGSPFRPMFYWPYVTVANRTTATGAGLSNGNTDVASTFVITAMDNGGHVRNATGDGWTVNAQHTLRPDVYFDGHCYDPARNGTWVCRYHPTVTGIYRLNITLNGNSNVTVPSAHIVGSPYLVNITFGALSVPNCRGIGDGTTVRDVHARHLVSLMWCPLHDLVVFACVRVCARA